MAFIGNHKYMMHILAGLDGTFPLCELWFLAEQECLDGHCNECSTDL